MTQEELAKELYVSRTAISKWESGRGYPEMESLKRIARFYGVTLDELIGGEEMADLAEENLQKDREKSTTLICGVLDCLSLLLFFIPVFGERMGEDVAFVGLLFLKKISGWLKIFFFILLGLTVANGISATVVANFEKEKWNRHRLITGLILLIFSTGLFILARQPYPAIFTFCLLLTKGFFLLRR